MNVSNKHNGNDVFTIIFSFSLLFYVHTCSYRIFFFETIFFARKPAWKDGSTAVCVMAVNDTLYIANVGDSRVSSHRL